MAMRERSGRGAGKATGTVLRSWRPGVRTWALLLLLAPLLAVPARAQSFPATYVGFASRHCGEWIAELPGCWAFIDFESPWKFFPDNDGSGMFAAFIPRGDVLLDSDSVIDDTGVVVPFLGVEVSTLALGSDAHLILATAGSLKVEGFGGIGGLITNQGRITLQGSAVLETPFAAQLIGSGDIVLDGASSVFRTLGLLSQADGHALRGEGNIFASALFNDGLVIADRVGKDLNVSGALVTNSGTLRAGGLAPGVPGGELRLDPLVLDNSGDIVAEHGFLKIEDSDFGNTGLVEARPFGTVVLQDVDVDGDGGIFAVRSGGTFVLNGSNRVDGGAFVADAGAEFAIGPGTTTLTGSMTLQGLLATRGGTLRFDGVDLAMPNGTIELGAGVLAQVVGPMSTFRGGTWAGAGALGAFTATRWDAQDGIHNDGLTIDLHLATHRALGTIRNDGVMSLVVDSGFNQTLSLLLDGDLAFEGSGTLRLRGSNGPLRIAAGAGGARLRNGADHLLRVEAGANATILANTTNEGRLEVRGANAFLAMPLQAVRNTGVLGAFDGGVLTLRDTGTAAMLLHNTGGVIEAGTGSRIVMSDGHPATAHRTTIRGGTLAGAGRFEAAKFVALDGATDGALTIAAGATVRAGTGTNLYLNGHIVNDGTIDLLDGTNFLSGNGNLWIEGAVSLGGSGRTVFSIGNEMRILGTSPDARLRVGEAQTIAALTNTSGSLDAHTTNLGRIEARGANAFLTLPTAFVRNEGVLGAFDGGVLTLRDTGMAAMLLHNTGGVIEAGTGSRIVLSDGHPATAQFTTIRGGTLGGAGRFDVGRLVYLDGVTDGAVTIAAGGTVRAGSQSGLFVTGNLVNHGTIDLRDETGSLTGVGTLWIDGNVTMAGSGRTVFTIGNEMRILGTSTAARLQVGEAQTIAALTNTNGTFNVHTTNLGRIEVRGANAFLTLPTAFMRNEGMLGAFEGGVLTLRDTGTAPMLLHNKGGLIEAGTGSRIVLSDGHPATSHFTTIRGGTLGGAGRFDVGRLVYLDGATDGALTITAGGTVRAGSQSGLFVTGNLVNDGTIDLRDETGSLTGVGTLWIDGTVNLGGVGRVDFSQSEEMRIRGTNAGARLTVGSEQIIGARSGASGSLDVHITNHGRIEARGANAFLTLPTAFVRNEGVLGAFEGGVLTLRDNGAAPMLLDNTSGLIEAGAGSRIVLSDGHPATAHRTTIRGGTLAGGGRFDVARLVAFDGATDGALTIATGASVRVGAGANLFLAGTIVNDGLLDLADTTDHTSGGGFLWIEGAVDLLGTGRTTFTRLNEMQIRGTDATAKLRLGAQQVLGTRANTFGTLNVHTTNLGRIEARGANAFLDATTPFILNAGLIGAFDGGVLTIRETAAGNMQVDNRGGRMEAGAGSRILLAGNTSFTTVSGGTLAGSGRFEAGRLVVLDGATAGALTIEEGATVRAGTGTNLYLSGHIVNDGTIDLLDGTNFLSGNGNLWIAGDVTLGGSGRTVFTVGNEMRILGASPDAQLRVGEAQTIAAKANTFGTLNVRAINLGRIEVRGANAFLDAPTPFILNAGLIGAFDGGVLTIRETAAGNMQVDNRGGRMEAGAGSRILLAGSTSFTTVSGGTLAGAGRFEAGRLVVLDGATAGALTIEEGATVRAGTGTNLYLKGHIVNDGTIDLLDGTGFLSGEGTLWVLGDATLEGRGQVQFSAGTEMRIAGIDGNAVLRVDDAQTIVARANTSGVVRVDVVNDGVVEARGGGAFLALETDSIVNGGRIGAEAAGVLRIGAPLGLTVLDNREGELHVGNGSQLFLHGATHPSHTAHTLVRGGEINGTGTLFTQGRVTLTDGVVLAPGNSPGVLTVEGDLALDPFGALEIEILGPTLGREYDQLLVRGQLTMGGMLELLFPMTYRPTSTDVFTVLSATQLVGGFTNVRNGRVEFRFGTFDVLSDRSSLRLMNFVAAVDPVGVPAPPVLSLLLAGMLFALHRRRRALA